MQLAGKRVVIVGLGRSGVAAARLCLAADALVIGTDSRPLAELPKEVRKLPIHFKTGGHGEVDFMLVDLIVVSPGVPSFPGLEAAIKVGVPVVSELELGSWFVEAPVTAVGGTNGKSTTTMLITTLFRQAGRRVFAGGNLGKPLCEVASPVCGEIWDELVLEVSSFQLERINRFHPCVSLLLNITEDHLDRYMGFDDYVAAKGNAFVNQTHDDVAIVPAGDELCLEQARRGRAKRITFGRGGDYQTEASHVLEVATGRRYDLGRAQLLGACNVSNAAAAIAAVRARGVSPEQVERGLAAFDPLPHRMQLVATIAGVSYYDDSKATNVGAAVTALEGLCEPKAVLIAGGRDKQGSYEPLVQALRQRGRGLVLIGEAADRIERAAAGALPVAKASDMDDAVKRAKSWAKSGDAVLLSPACSSFDMFKSYAERGDCFAAAVRTLEAAPVSSRRSPRTGKQASRSPSSSRSRKSSRPKAGGGT